MTRPNFLLVGAPKCGTGAISHFLGQHPDIFMAERREPNYFSSDLQHDDAATAEDYAALFADRPERLRGEGSTWYLYSNAAPHRILAECGPETRIIVVVRNPVELVRSLFDYRRFYASHQITNLPAALRLEEEHLDAVGRGEIRADPLKIHRAAALYSRGIRRYIELFGAARVKIVLYDDLVSDTRGLMCDLYDFLGVDDTFDFVDRRVNQSFGRRLYWLSRVLRWRITSVKRMLAFLPRGVRRGALRLVDRLNTREARHTPLPAAVKAELVAHFHDDVRSLEAITGRDLSHWIAPKPSSVVILERGPVPQVEIVDELRSAA